MGLLQLLGFAREGRIDRVFEVGDMRVTAYRDLMLFHVVPDRLDVRLLKELSCEPGSRPRGGSPLCAPPRREDR